MTAQFNEEEFHPIVLDQKVVFERLGEKKSDHVTGYIRVANDLFEKHVFVRYTRDNWNTSVERESDWVENVEQETDRFIFFIAFPAGWSGTIKFAIRYEVGEFHYWANNQNCVIAIN